MLYRKRILLTITEVFGDNINATDFQKLLFLFSSYQKTKKFNFVPYKYGCFSFQSLADKNNLIKEGYLKNHKNWKLGSIKQSFVDDLDEYDRKLLFRVKSNFGNMSTTELIRYVYINYPFYAINSEISKSYLSAKECNPIERLKTNDNSSVIYTIGYEGKTIDEYLCSLVKNKVKVLCDIRKNPQSRKYGFSKITLSNACNSLNIKYIHIPELGIDSDKRKGLNTQADYDKLFKEYELKTLKNQLASIKMILELQRNYNKVALTCFELLPKYCHRIKVAKCLHEFVPHIPIHHL